MLDLADRKRKLMRRFRGNRRKGGLLRRIRGLGMWFSDRRRLVLGLLVALAVPASLVAYVLLSPEFLVSEVRVNRCKHLDRDQVVDMLGLRSDQNIFLLNLRAVRERLEEHPWVDSVRVRRALPDVLEVRIKEKEPFALISLPELYYLDERGRVFKKLEKGDVRDYPVVTGLSGEDILGNQGADDLLVGAVEVLRAAASSKNAGLEEISEVGVDRFLGYTLFPMEGAPGIVLGSGDVRQQMHVLTRLKNQMGETLQQTRRIDLDVAGRAVIELAGNIGDAR